MIMSDLWDQISEIADLNKVKHLPSLSRSSGRVCPGGNIYNHPRLSSGHMTLLLAKSVY